MRSRCFLARPCIFQRNAMMFLTLSSKRPVTPRSIGRDGDRVDARRSAFLLYIQFTTLAHWVVMMIEDATVAASA